jgi:hypothetical protein
VRTITDIDVLAFRFPSGSPVPEPRGRRAPRGLHVGDVDPGLGIPDDSIDMIIGEVKEGASASTPPSAIRPSDF